MKFRNRFIAIFLVATFIFSASMVTSSAASKEKYFGKTPNGQKIYYIILTLLGKMLKLLY